MVEASGTTGLATPKEYADYYRVHVKTVLRWIRTQKLKGAVKTGKTVRIPWKSVPRC